MDHPTSKSQDRRRHEYQDEAVMQDITQDAPPPYYATQPISGRPFEERNAHGPSGSQSNASTFPPEQHHLGTHPSNTATPAFPHQPSTTPLPLPIVLPQISHSRRGAFRFPFLRAFPPILASHTISPPQFLTFLDGLNEVWIANPAFQGLDLLGFAMSQAHGVHPVQLAGVGVQVAAGLASAATSIVRTKIYVREMNRVVFGPRGLCVRIVGTGEMLERVGWPVGEEGRRRRLRVLGLEEGVEIGEGAGSSEDSRVRLIRALEGFVMQDLDLDVPAPETPENILKRMGNAQAKKAENKATKKREEEMRKRRGSSSSSSSSSSSDSCEKIERKLDKERRKMEKELGKKKAQKDEKERTKIIRDFEKEERKLAKEMEKAEREKAKKQEKAESERSKKKDKAQRKEDTKANKLRWILITNCDGHQPADEADVQEESDE